MQNRIANSVRLAALLGATCLAPLASGQTRLTTIDAAPLDWFGYDVAIDGSWGVVGSWRDDDAGPDTGSAHVLWVPKEDSAVYLHKLDIAGSSAGERAGENVAIGDGVIAVTVPGRVMPRGTGGSVTGAVVLFHLVQGVWQETAVLDDPSRSDGDLFGSAVAIVGDSILVGAPRDDQFAPDGGALYVFSDVGGTYVRSQKLAPADVGSHDYFGHDVGASGARAVASAYNDDDRGVNAGAAYALEHGSFGWQITQKLVASEGANFDLLGTCVSISGSVMAIGAPQNQDSDTEAVNDEGAVVVYEWSGSASKWVETMTLRPGDPEVEHRFGIDVAVGSDVIVVGASHSDTAVLNAGSTHVFRRRGRDWFEVARHEALTPVAYEYLGLSVAVGDTILVGVPGANDAGAGAGAVDVVDLPAVGGIWGQTFCHGDDRVDGFRNMGGPMNTAATLGRLTPAGTESVARDDLVLRSTGLPHGSMAILFLAARTQRRTLDDGVFCLSFSQGGYQFATQGIGADGRMIQRHPISRIESQYPGASSAMIGVRYYAQVAYYDSSTGRWNTTNALRIDFDV